MGYHPEHNAAPRGFERAKAHRALKPDHRAYSDSRLQPVFDDPTGAEARRYGVGLDHKFSSVLYGGVEVSRRDLIVPKAIIVAEDWEEDLYRGYLYWTPHPTLALGLGYHLEQFENESTLNPPSTRTQLFPAEIRYFHPSGLFGSLKVTYTRQQIAREIDSEIDRQDDEFALVDIALGYRLPKRYGILSVGVKNLFDTEFSFQGIGGSRTPRQEDTPLFLPEQTAFARFTLAF